MLQIKPQIAELFDEIYCFEVKNIKYGYFRIVKTKLIT